jgi:hypothetical protein
MNVNQLIAAGIQQPRFESPLNMMAQLSQLEAAREANALRQVQMQRLQRQEQQENELGALLASGAPLTVQNLGRFGKPGYDALAAQRQADLLARQLEEKDAAKQEKQRMAVAKAMYSTLGDPSRENFDNTFRFLKEQGLTKDIEPIFAEMMMQTPEQRRQSIISFANAVPGMQAYFQDFDKQRAEIEAKQAEALYKRAQTRELSMKMAGTLPEPAGAPPEIIRLQRSLSNLPPNDPNRPAIEARIEALGKQTGTTVNVAPQEGALQKKLGDVKGTAIEKGFEAARDAESIIDTIDIGRQILNAGATTGFGANFLVNLGQALKQVGVDLNADESANAQTYMANMAQNVGRVIKLFGAGTGLSNADREYAEKMAGGNVSLDERALRRILDINERMSRNVIKRHNENVDRFNAGEEFKIKPPAQTADSMRPQDRQALDWARAHPDDPRASEILRRLRVQ